MFNYRPILFINGVLLTVLSVAMIIPTLVDLLSKNEDWVNFLISAFLTAFAGLLLIFTNKEKIQKKNLNIRQAFILTTSCWVVLASFSALPFIFAPLGIGFVDAFFESMSGLTTTGSTILSGLDDMPPGILVWRSLLQWLGGVGIIVMAMAVLPMLKIGGMQLFRTESSEKSDKVLPRSAQVSIAITSIYFALTVICATCLWFAGMNFFDAICHAMTTVSTAGFSTHDQSIAYFDNPKIEYVMVIFMILSAIPFLLYIQVLRGKTLVIFKDSQVRLFFILLIACVLLMTYWVHMEQGLAVKQSFRYALFNITSVITTSGFASTDYSQWGGFAVTLIFLISVTGGCTGSTTGGIKIYRYQILFQTARTQIHHLFQPNAVLKTTYNNKIVSEAIKASVMSFVILFVFCFIFMAVLLSFSGLDYLTSLSAAAATMSNLGPGLGDIIGPSGNYAGLTDMSKWVLSVAMLIGRLEVYTVLVLFLPSFWQE